MLGRVALASNDGYGAVLGAFGEDLCRFAVRPIATSILATSDGSFTSTPAVSNAQTADIPVGATSQSNRPKCVACQSRYRAKRQRVRFFRAVARAPSRGDGRG